MSGSPEREEKVEHTDRPGEIARRAVLRRGAKLVYVVPAVLAAMRATPTYALSGGGCVLLKGVFKRGIEDVPADVLAVIAAVEREFIAA